MSKVTLKSTKQEILDALHAAEKQIAEQKKVVANPGESTQKVREQEVVAAAAEDVESGIFSDSMNDKFLNLKTAIQLLETQLKEKYGVDSELADMTIVVNAKKQAQMALDAEFDKQKAAIDAELAQKRQEFAAEIERLKAENASKRAELDKARKREQEEYDYDITRKRKMDADKYADELAALEKKLAETEAALAVRQADVDAIDAMKARIDALPEELESKYQEGVEAGKKDAGKEYGYKTAMAEKDHTYELRERDSRIERLEADCTAKAEKISALETKLDTAYAQLRELATKTVESSGGVKIIGANGDSPARK